MNAHPYKYMYAHATPISTSERLSRFNLEIHEVGSASLSTGTSPPTERIISCKYNTHVKSII
jgi:hypothetical protein